MVTTHLAEIFNNYFHDLQVSHLTVERGGKNAAEIERGLISAWTKKALRTRRTTGLPVGRSKGPGKSKLNKHRPEIEALLANGSPQKFIAKRYHSSPANLANWLKKRRIKKLKL